MVNFELQRTLNDDGCGPAYRVLVLESALYLCPWRLAIQGGEHGLDIGPKNVVTLGRVGPASSFITIPADDFLTTLDKLLIFLLGDFELIQPIASRVNLDFVGHAVTVADTAPLVTNGTPLDQVAGALVEMHKAPVGVIGSPEQYVVFAGSPAVAST